MTHLPSCANSIWIVLTKVHCSFSCKRRAADEEIVESEKIGPIKRMKHFFANIECDNLSLDFDSVLHNLYFWAARFIQKLLCTVSWLALTLALALLFRFFSEVVAWLCQVSKRPPTVTVTSFKLITLIKILSHLTIPFAAANNSNYISLVSVYSFGQDVMHRMARNGSDNQLDSSSWCVQFHFNYISVQVSYTDMNHFSGARKNLRSELNEISSQSKTRL